jgi:hypothetical protein
MISLCLHGVSTKKIPKSPSSIPTLGITILKESGYFKVRFEDQTCQDQVIYIDHGKYFNVNYNKVGLHCKIKDVL